MKFREDGQPHLKVAEVIAAVGNLRAHTKANTTRKEVKS